MFDCGAVLKHEIDSYESFTEKVVKAYGIIYHNPDNPSSYDSNHAHILDLDRPLDTTLRDIISFYTGKNLEPRIYASFIASEFEILRPHLVKHGFTVSTYDNNYMVLNNTYSPRVDDTLSMHRISRMSPDVVELIERTDGGDWGVKALAYKLRHDFFHLLGLCSHERYLAIASVEIMDGYSRIDDVATHPDHRRQRLGTRLINYLVAYHAAVSANYLYLYTNNPVAARMYKKSGFEEFMIERPSWSAHIPSG